MPNSIRDTLERAAQQLIALPQASPVLEAEILLCHATDLDRAKLRAWPEKRIDDFELEHFEDLIQRRLAGEPIAYIRGRQAFWNLDLQVSPATLIPRPETELLVELSLDRLPEDAPLLVLDAGCGSGAIAAALALERPAWTLIATDRSIEAARVASANRLQCAASNAGVIVCDWLAPIAEASLHALISNPPYVRETDPHLTRGDLPFEPRAALTAGPDGLDAIRDLSKQAASRLKPAGFFALEHGFDQGPAVRRILAQQGFGMIASHCDLAGHERATSGRLTSRGS